jgi:hypothetical protein
MGVLIIMAIIRYMFGVVEKMDVVEMEKKVARRCQVQFRVNTSSFNYLVVTTTQQQLVKMAWC